MIPCKAHKILTFPLSLAIDITDTDRGEEWGGAGSAGGGIRRRRVSEDVLASVSGGEEVKPGGLPPERGRGNNGRIMAGRDRGVDDWRKRRWRREGSDCGATDCPSWFRGVDV